MGFLTPHRPGRAEIEIRKSRFIGHCLPVDSRETALAQVATLRDRHPEARHVCWAYVLGDPQGTASAGMDDDGEPAGTAGRPLLNLLQKQRVGNALLVVVRYYGGVKLGAGGLTRAYSQSGAAALEAAELAPCVPLLRLKIETPYALEARVRHLLAAAGALGVQADFRPTGVRLTATLPETATDEIVQACKALQVKCNCLQAD